MFLFTLILTIDGICWSLQLLKRLNTKHRNTSEVLQTTNCETSQIRLLTVGFIFLCLCVFISVFYVCMSSCLKNVWGFWWHKIHNPVKLFLKLHKYQRVMSVECFWYRDASVCRGSQWVSESKLSRINVEVFL